MKSIEREESVRSTLKLAQMALSNKRASDETVYKALNAIHKALAQPEHEFVRGECVKCGASIEKQRPAAWVSEIAEEAELMLEKPRFRAVPLYATPTQRKEPEQEPAFYIVEMELEALRRDGRRAVVLYTKPITNGIEVPVYTAPPQRNSPTPREVKDVLRSTGLLTNTQSWEVAEEVMKLLAAHGIKGDA